MYTRASKVLIEIGARHEAMCGTGLDRPVVSKLPLDEYGVKICTGFHLLRSYMG